MFVNNFKYNSFFIKNILEIIIKTDDIFYYWLRISQWIYFVNEKLFLTKEMFSSSSENI